MAPAPPRKPIEKRRPGRTGIVLAGLLAITVSPLAARALVMLTGCAGGDFGDDCSVAELVAGGSIRVDNSIFDAWSYSGNGIAATDILVTPIGEGTSDPGGGVQIAAPGIGSDASVDFELNYDVATADGSVSLDGYRFAIDLGQITGAAGAFAATQVVDNDSLDEIACEGLVPCGEPIPDQNDPVKSDRFTDPNTGVDVLSRDLNANTNMMAFSGTGESLEFIRLEQSFSSPPFCGDGLLAPGEQCDDGNTTAGDGCDASCASELPNCGDGVLDPGEECDDGNTTRGDGCDEVCMEEVPEPSAVLMLGTGALVLLGARRLRGCRAAATCPWPRTRARRHG